MTGRKIYLACAVMFVLQLAWFDYGVVTGENWKHEHRTLGIPTSPWYVSRWSENEWEGLGSTSIRLLSGSFGLGVLGGLMLWGAWYTKDYVAELEVEKLAHDHPTSPTDV